MLESDLGDVEQPLLHGAKICSLTPKTTNEPSSQSGNSPVLQESNSLESDPHSQLTQDLASSIVENPSNNYRSRREPEVSDGSITSSSQPQGATLPEGESNDVNSCLTVDLAPSAVSSNSDISLQTNRENEANVSDEPAVGLEKELSSTSKDDRTSLHRVQKQSSSIVSITVPTQTVEGSPSNQGKPGDSHDPHVDCIQTHGSMHEESPKLNDSYKSQILRMDHDGNQSSESPMQRSLSPLLKPSLDSQMDLDTTVPTLANLHTSNFIKEETIDERNIDCEHDPDTKSISSIKRENAVGYASSQLESSSLKKGDNDSLGTKSTFASDNKSRGAHLLEEDKEPLPPQITSKFPANQSLEELIEAEKMNVDAEFEIDSSPIQSSSDTSSVSSSSEDSSDDDYEMLDPAEQARRLMQEDGGSDDDGAEKGNKTIAGPLRTLNEKPDEVVKKPDITVTQDMKIEELGVVENTIENLVLIKAKISGEYQVLEFGSVLCLESRVVIGVVGETLGRVQQPYYSVRFTNAAAISEIGISHGTPIFYVEQHSTTVFTQPLKAFKGSDASNLHDEEVGDDEIEFSDDEAEAEYKKKLKLTKQAKRGARQGQINGMPWGARHGSNNNLRNPDDRSKDDNHTTRIKYDDHSEEDDLYTPLIRPSNLHEIMGPREAPLEDQNVRQRTDATNQERSRDHGRARGDRAIRGSNRRRARGENRNQRNPGALGRRVSNDVNDDQEYHRRQHENDALPPQWHPSQYSPHSRDFDTARLTNSGSPEYPPVNYPLAPLNPPFSSFAYPTHGTQPHSQYGEQNLHQPYYSPTINYPPQTQPSSNYTPQQNQIPFPYSAPHQHYQYQPQEPHIPYFNQQPRQSPLSNQPTPNIPPGAHINPAFFPIASQNHFVRHAGPQHSPTQLPSPSGGDTRMSPESETAFRAAQDRLDVLRKLSQ